MTVQSPTLDNPLAAFHRMRAIATGLFLLMTLVFLTARWFEDTSPVLPFVRAFAEAAMVGALADWFAVTALFRHPMGLPIPHTAIVPRSKDRIGSGLGRFISQNFLQPEQVERRLKDIDLAGAFSRWIGEGERSKRLARSIAAAVPRILGLLNDGKIAAWLQSAVAERLKTADVASLIAEGLELLTRKGRHKPIVDLIIFHADLTVHSEEGEFRRRVTEKTDWLPKLLSIDSAASDALLTAIKDTLKAAAKDPNHSVRTRIDEALAHLARDLRNDPNLRDGLQRWVREMAEHDQLRKYLSQIWSDLKASLQKQPEEETDRLAMAIAGGLEDLAQAIERDPDLKESLNTRLKGWAIELADAQGENVGKMVADTIRGWDAQTVVNQIETAVGRDLQYIRINGTVIGGLVGVVIYTLSHMFMPN
jgi:uncharacterized membrane-anchored protein YjiN (DUF445 family)